MRPADFSARCGKGRKAASLLRAQPGFSPCGFAGYGSPSRLCARRAFFVSRRRFLPSVLASDVRFPAPLAQGSRGALLSVGGFAAGGGIIKKAPAKPCIYTFTLHKNSLAKAGAKPRFSPKLPHLLCIIYKNPPLRLCKKLKTEICINIRKNLLTMNNYACIIRSSPKKQ